DNVSETLEDQWDKMFAKRQILASFKLRSTKKSHHDRDLVGLFDCPFALSHVRPQPCPPSAMSALSHVRPTNRPYVFQSVSYVWSTFSVVNFLSGQLSQWSTFSVVNFFSGQLFQWSTFSVVNFLNGQLSQWSTFSGKGGYYLTAKLSGSFADLLTREPRGATCRIPSKPPACSGQDKNG
ncbi:hypothetical protein Btru_007326, partial [Bulinus truncatus]